MEQSELYCLIDWSSSPSVHRVMGWLETLCRHTILFPTNRQSPALSPSVWPNSYPWEHTDPDRLREWAQSRLWLGIIEMPKAFTVSVQLCLYVQLYLIQQQFHYVLFYNLNTNLSIHHAFEDSGEPFVSRLSGSSTSLSTPPPPSPTYKLLLTTGWGVISPPEILSLFL